MHTLTPDKESIAKNFYKSRLVYEENALVQKKMAEKLVSFLAAAYDTILEIGIGSGTLTKLVYPACTFKQYYAIDIIEENKDFLEKQFPKIRYSCFDMDSIKDFCPQQTFHLILSNAVIQWSANPAQLIQTCMEHLSPNGTLALSFFGEKNFYEIKDIFGVGLSYLSHNEINEIGKKYEIVHSSQEILELRFPDTISLLRHIKNTGVGGMSHTAVKKEQLKQYAEIYQNRLTYNPVYLILKKHS